ncbi:hypothetical protein GYA13_02160 [Candidatus Kuenenbacteria bacterium]|nr:hypothetical protein [Candidatus Kuenenbacteria bacterium]
MDIAKLQQFIIQAKKATYASGGENQAKNLSNGRKEYIFKEGRLEYVDRYKGHEEFMGKEEVSKNKKLLWQMKYKGKVLNDKIPADDIYIFLRKVLRQVPADKPFRGPIKFCDREYKYINIVNGDLEKFFGKEQVYYKKALVYELDYLGGATNNPNLTL